jgi:hypothetical protein
LLLFDDGRLEALAHERREPERHRQPGAGGPRPRGGRLRPFRFALRLIAACRIAAGVGAPATTPAGGDGNDRRLIDDCPTVADTCHGGPP